MRHFGFALLLTAVSCGDDNGTSPDLAMTPLDMSAAADLNLGPAGGAQMCTGTFVADAHCDAMGDMSAIASATDQNSCHPDTDMIATPDYGDTMCGTAGKDDDCKYQVSWSSTAIFENTDVTFTVTLAPNLAGNQVTGAAAVAEVFLDQGGGNVIPGDTSKSMTTEMSGGVYKIGPVRFTQKGQWTVRFHFFETCSDVLDDSPHGHAAFFVNVP